ncbi:MAG: thrombospondin type 3 repeat-containing protein [bacterium]
MATGLWLVLLIGAGGVARAAALSTTLGPRAPVPSAANGYELTATIAYGGYVAEVPASMRFGAASSMALSLDAAAHQVTIQSMILDAGTVRIAGFPFHDVRLVSLFSGPITFAFDPATGAFSTLIYLTLVATLPGYGEVPLASGSASISGTFEYQGSPATGPVTMSMTATGSATLSTYYYVSILVDGALAVDFVSNEPAYPDGELEGAVAVLGDQGAPVPVPDAWVGNFGQESRTHANGAFGFDAWPRQVDPTWTYAAIECGSSWVMGSSMRASLANGGTTQVGTVDLTGAPGAFEPAAGISVATSTPELVTGMFDQLTSPTVVMAVRRPDGTQRVRFARNTGGGFQLYADVDAQGDIRRDLLASKGFQQPIVLYPNATQQAVSVIWVQPNLTTVAGPLHIPAGGPAVALRVANVTKTEGPDLLVAIEDQAGGPGRVVRVPSITPGQWGEPETVYQASGPIHAIESRPLDDDGFDDLVIAESATGACKVLLSSGPSSFVETQSVACPLDARGAIAQDLDGDGDWDLAFAGDADASGSGRVTVLSNDAGVLSPVHVDFGRNLAAIDSASWIVPARRAFVVASPGDATIDVVAEDGHGGFAVVDGVSSVVASSVVAQDLDNDGFDDLLAVTGGEVLERWRNQLVSGDGDGDGVDDVTELARGLDCADSDSDGDGIADGVDVCPTQAGASQADADGDRIGDACDNCPDVFNANQADDDRDGIGNACEGGVVGRHFTPDTGETNEFTFHLGNFVGALDTKTAQVLTTSFVDLIFDPQANQLTLQGLELALSDMHFFGLFNIAMMHSKIVLASSGGVRTVAVDPNTGEFSFDLLVTGYDVSVGTQPQLPGGLLTLGGTLSADGHRLSNVYAGFVTTPLTAFLGPYYLVGPGTLNFAAP